jgi:hypothetical protein
MMGQLDSGQDKLFYSFNLDNHVPHTHLLRGIDRALAISATCVSTSHLSTVRLVDLRLIQNS